MMPFGRRPCYTRRLVSAATAAAVLVAVTGSAALAHNAGWLSGARNNDATTAFASWRGTPRLGVVSGWIDCDPAPFIGPGIRGIRRLRLAPAE